MIVCCTRSALWMHQCKPVAVQVGIEMVAAQRCEALGMFDVESIIDGSYRMESVEILRCPFTTIGIQCWFYQDNGIAKTFYDICILGGHKIVSCQDRCVCTSQFSTMYVISQLDNDLLIIVIGRITVIRICQFYMILTDALQILDVLRCGDMQNDVFAVFMGTSDDFQLCAV